MISSSITEAASLSSVEASGLLSISSLVTALSLAERAPAPVPAAVPAVAPALVTGSVAVAVSAPVVGTVPVSVPAPESVVVLVGDEPVADVPVGDVAVGDAPEPVDVGLVGAVVPVGDVSVPVPLPVVPVVPVVIPVVPPVPVVGVVAVAVGDGAVGLSGAVGEVGNDGFIDVVGNAVPVGITSVVVTVGATVGAAVVQNLVFPMAQSFSEKPPLPPSRNPLTMRLEPNRAIHNKNMENFIVTPAEVKLIVGVIK